MTKTKTKTKTKIKVTQQYLDDLKFWMMPVDGGQIVEVTYACDEDGVWQKKYDRSDCTTSYRFAPYCARATEEQLKFEPQNGRIPSHNRWRDVLVV